MSPKHPHPAAVQGEAVRGISICSPSSSDSLKIEGRTKSPYYVARVAQAYRAAIDAAVAGRSLDPALIDSLDGLDGVRTGGTMVVVEGPRFSTRAESQHYAAQGWSLINMTGHPEAVLARELQMCYAAIALVTDMDAGVESGEGVGQEEVFTMFARNVERLKVMLGTAIADLPDPDGCACATWADGLVLPYDVPVPQGAS